LDRREPRIPALTDHLEDKGGVIGIESWLPIRWFFQDPFGAFNSKVNAASRASSHAPRLMALNSSGNFATFAAIRHASSRVSNFAADLTCENLATYATRKTRSKFLRMLATPAGFEPATFSLEGYSLPSKTSV